MELSTLVPTGNLLTEYDDALNETYTRKLFSGLDSETRRLFRAGNILFLYVLPVFIFSGTIGNILAIVTLQGRSFRSSTSGFVMSALAVADITVLATGAMNAWLLFVNGTTIRFYHVALCKAHRFLTYLSLEVSAWTLVLITLERLVAVVWPLKAAFVCSRTRIALVWTLLVITLATANVFIPIESKIFKKGFVISGPDNTSTTIVEVSCAMESSSNSYLHWSHLTLGTLIPSGFIFLGNAVIIYRLAQQRIRRGHMVGSVVNNKTSSVTTMLVIVSAVFLLTTLPANIFFIGVDNWFDRNSIESRAKMHLTGSTTNVLAYLNNTINFLLYFVAGGRFRRAFWEMICRRKPPVVTGTKSNLTA